MCSYIRPAIKNTCLKEEIKICSVKLNSWLKKKGQQKEILVIKMFKGAQH